jgi:acyl-[acyl-carrier-protein] desaturase
MSVTPRFGTAASAAVLFEIRGEAERLFDRHLASARDWLPYAERPEHRPSAPVVLDEGTRSALHVGLLTEDNLPYYTSGSALVLADPVGDVYRAWVQRWTAEEARHAIALRTYAIDTGCLDTVMLERDRMAHTAAGWSAPFNDHLDALIYPSLQELATRVAHRNTFVRLPAGPGRDRLGRIVTDENLHHLFYRDLAQAAFAVDPSLMLEALEREVAGFEMPGGAIPGLAHHAAVIQAAGIYDLAIYVEQVLVPVVLRHWRIESLEGLTDRAERARDRILARIDRLRRVAVRLAGRPRTVSAGAAAVPSP